jgi:3-dehydroshikimate dehydratase
VPLLRPGLCSVTLRALPVEQVVPVAARAGLEAIEWGADVHAPPDDAAAVATVIRCTAEAGLAVASYGSYLRLCGDEERHAGVVTAAVALGAARIRVWAGERGSAAASAQERHVVVRGARALAARAADAGLTVGFEFHGGTLTDTVASTLRLLEEVDHPAVGTYWQPPQGVPDDEAVEGLRRVAPHVVAVHAFSWWPRAQRHPLTARQELWTRVVAELTTRGVPTDVLLEFVPADDPAGVARDAAALRRLLA